MDMSHGASQLAATALSPVQVAKAALRRLAWTRSNRRRRTMRAPMPPKAGRRARRCPRRRARCCSAWPASLVAEGSSSGDDLVRALMAGHWDEAADILGNAAAQAQGQGQDWADLLQRLALGLERGSKLWTAARKKDSLMRVLGGSRSDARRLRERLRHLLAAWESETEAIGRGYRQRRARRSGDLCRAVGRNQPRCTATRRRRTGSRWCRTWKARCAPRCPTARCVPTNCRSALQQLSLQVADAGATPQLVRHAGELCQRARRLLGHRQHLLDELGKLCVELTQGLTELAEDDSWARGQCELLKARLAEGLNVRSVRAASDLLANARKRQGVLRNERNQARDALKELIQGMLTELGEFSEHTGRFHANVGRHAEAIAKADSLGSLADVVREMLHDSSEVQALVSQTQSRLQAEQARAGDMQLRVRELEGELRRLSDEVSTDALTQVANRRGLAQAFEVERARMNRSRNDNVDCSLAVGLIDIDNFKKLNDTLGHAAGDVALQKLAAQVREQLRPRDTVARFGGEEFVVLLPDIDPAEAQKVLTRLQRQLTASLFMHDNKEVFVTFSAGVTALREAEPLELALERADEALYEAKRTGKNRTCIG